MTREELVDKICPVYNIDDCINENEKNCSECECIINELLDKYDRHVREKAIDECIDIVEHLFGCFLNGTAQGCVRWNMEQLKEENK